MGKHVHVLSEVDVENRTAICASCGPTSLRKSGPGWRCKTAANVSKRYVGEPPRSKWVKKKKLYRQSKLTECQRCGFIPEDMCQLDVHHLNHNHTDNRPENLYTLCANCHRLQHFKAPKEY